MAPPRPDHLAGLVGEIERRLTGSEPPISLGAELASVIPDKAGYVVVVFDGLGVTQLDHVDSGPLRSALRGVLTSPFPTTTSAALSSLVTGRDPAGHGLTAHLMWRPDLGKVVNTLKWVDLSGSPVHHDYASVLPAPNLWERLRDRGIEPITVQPAAFAGTPLSEMLYRGARFEPSWDDHELLEATLQLASVPGRLVFTYHWRVDYAGHVHGLESPQFAEAIRHAAQLWEQLAARIPSHVGLVATADHGLIGYRDEDKILVRDPRFDGIRFAGDPRGVQMWGPPGAIDDFAALTGGIVTDPADLFDGSVPTGAPDTVILAPKGKVILPPGFDKRLRAYHGGLEPEETQVPLLVG